MRLIVAVLLWALSSWLTVSQDVLATESSTAARKGLEAVGKTGPLELRLELPRKDVPRGGRIHFRVSLKNIGKKPVAVSDYAFKNPKHFAKNRDRENSTYLVVIGPDAKDVYFSRAWVYPMFCPPKIISIPPGQRTTVQAGISLDGDPFEAHDRWLRDNPEFSTRQLKAGESITSPAWAAPHWVDCEETPQPLADEFTELWNVDLEQPGTYRVKAVHDATLSGKFKKRYAKMLARQEGIVKDISASEVRVETPWLEVLVR